MIGVMEEQPASDEFLFSTLDIGVTKRLSLP